MYPDTADFINLLVLFVVSNGAENNCRISHNLGILLINSNCFAIYFHQHSSCLF